MILKKGNTNLEFKVSKSDLNSGLAKDDYWCLVEFMVKNKDIFLESTIPMISKNEYFDLISKLHLFLEDNFIQKGRIAFIKNFFIIYLEASLRIGKRMKIKLVHINDDDDSYMLYLKNDEITNFLECLEMFKDKI